MIWYFCICRWFWHFYGSGLLIHTALLTVMVYSVFIADKFPEEVSLFLRYIRIPASESGILRYNALKHLGLSYRFRWLHILRNNIFKCTCLQSPLTWWTQDHWILWKADQRHAQQSWPVLASTLQIPYSCDINFGLRSWAPALLNMLQIPLALGSNSFKYPTLSVLLF